MAGASRGRASVTSQMPGNTRHTGNRTKRVEGSRLHGTTAGQQGMEKRDAGRDLDAAEDHHGVHLGQVRAGHWDVPVTLLLVVHGD